MKIAVLSDIHGNAAALRAVIRDMRKEGIRNCVFLGDLIAKGPQPQEVWELLRRLHPMGWILGNTDLWMNRDRRDGSRREQTIQIYRRYAERWLSRREIASLLHRPESAAVRFKGRRIRCLHGSARSLTEAITPGTQSRELSAMLAGIDEPTVLCGHSHIPCTLKAPRHTVFNPGSVGCPYDGNPNASYGILTLGETSRENSVLSFSIRRVRYPIEETLRAARRRGFPFYGAYAALLFSGRKIGSQIK